MSRKGGERPAGRVEPLRAPRKCAHCNQPSVRAFFPFCSKRCADIDLGAWLNGRYQIPGEETAVISREDEE